MNSRIHSLVLGILILSAGTLAGQDAAAQPLGSPIELLNDTPAYDEIGLQAVTAGGTVALASSAADEREPKVSILANGSTAVFWVNRSGSHHVSGVDAAGNRLLPVFDMAIDIDILAGVNTGTNTNWTLNKANPAGNVFMAGATFLADTLTGSQAVIPEAVIDTDGIKEDNQEGHGFFRLFNDQLQPLTPPISVAGFSAGHREWDACWLNDGKLVIGTVARGHHYAADPDWPQGGSQAATLNLFNSDGTRFKEEFFVDDLTGQQGNVWLGALQNGFVCVYQDDDSRINGSILYKGIIFNLDGEPRKMFTVTDEALGLHPAWMAAGGGGTFVTVYETVGPAGIGLPEELVNMPVVLAQLWNEQGERIGPYILVSQHSDGRSVSRTRCAMARNGTFAVSWIDNAANDVQFTESVVGRVFNADGLPATKAFVVHPLPEFPETDGGNASESMPAAVNGGVAFTWASRAVPGGEGRDIALMVFGNPGTMVPAWEVY
ncbi:MAG: hypothetical protein ACE15F_08905 [bacterium]